MLAIWGISQEKKIEKCFDWCVLEYILKEF